MKNILFILLFVPLIFAGWESTAALTLTISVIIIASLYGIGLGFGLNDVQLLAKEEVFQLVATALLIVGLVASNSVINTISTLDEFKDGTSKTIQESAKKSLSDSITYTGGVLKVISKYDNQASKEASKSSQCSMMGMGYSVSGCGGFTMLATPLSMAGSVSGFAIGEMAAMRKLIEVTEAIALPFLLPLGLLLRTLKFTRGAGGLLIAVAISAHIMLPAGVFFNDSLSATFLADKSSDAYKKPIKDPKLSCDPSDTGVVEYRIGNDSNEIRAVTSYLILKENIRSYIFTLLIQATLGPILSLLLMATSIRAISSLAGADVDVSAISRFV